VKELGLLFPSLRFVDMIPSPECLPKPASTLTPDKSLPSEMVMNHYFTSEKTQEGQRKAGDAHIALLNVS
jgi:hypothetical protein